MDFSAMQELDKAKTKVLKYILYQKRTEGQIRTKFSNTIEENLLEDVICYLKEAGYINDKDYIQRTVHNFEQLKNLSRKELRYKLMAKNLPKELIEDYFAEHREELLEYEEKSARTIFEKKSKAMEPEEIKLYLLKKGYSKEAIQKAWEEE